LPRLIKFTGISVRLCYLFWLNLINSSSQFFSNGQNLNRNRRCEISMFVIMQDLTPFCVLKFFGTCRRSLSSLMNRQRTIAMYGTSLSNRSYALNVPLVMQRAVMKYSLRQRNRGVFIFELTVGSCGKISCPRHNSTVERRKNTLKSPFFLNTCYIVLRYRFST